VFWRLPAIKLAPDVIIPLFPDGSGITNTLLCTWISIIVLVALFYFGTRRSDLIPSGIQNFLEWGIESLLSLVEGVAGKEKAKKFFPLVATFFLFIVVSNLLDVIPGVDTIGAIDGPAIAAAHPSCQPFLGFLPNCHPVGPLLFGDISNKIIPWIRPATSDLNLTFSMALISVVVTQIFGFYTLGAGQHLSKYFNFKALLKFNFTGFIEFFVGILELITEISRLLSFSFRLFGNIFAGSAVLAVFAFVVPLLADVIFIPLELFVAFVQALIFSLLTLVFLEIATTSHEQHAQSEDLQEARQEFAENEEREAVAGRSAGH
jgi:F-type H+-transporting ATPase subunit a